MQAVLDRAAAFRGAARRAPDTRFTPFVVTRAGRIVAYATTLSMFAAAYAVAETEADMAGLIAGAVAATGAPASFLLSTHQHSCSAGPSRPDCAW